MVCVKNLMGLGGQASATSKPSRWWDLNACLRMAELNHRDQVWSVSGSCVLSLPFLLSWGSLFTAPLNFPGPAHLWLLAAPVDRSTPSSSLCIGLSSLGRPPVPNGRCLFHTPHPYANGPVSVVICRHSHLSGPLSSRAGLGLQGLAQSKCRTQPSWGSK